MIGYEDQPNPSTRVKTPSDNESIVLRSRYHKPVYQFLKRAFDIIFSLSSLILLSPIYGITALVIAATDGTPVIFRQTRLGKFGKLFQIYKFRSMVKNAEEVLRAHPELWKEYQETYKIKNDPRISKVGQFLRSTTLDELPQLLNVLRGEMSIVGPRPIVQAEVAKFGEFQETFLSMKPGCAGLWQCSGRSDTTYEERVAFEKEYFEKASIMFDLKIIFKTMVAVILRRGAA